MSGLVVVDRGGFPHVLTRAFRLAKLGNKLGPWNALECSDGWIFCRGEEILEDGFWLDGPWIFKPCKMIPTYIDLRSSQNKFEKVI